ncbi:MAG: FKBP-type peptidyl-prolyl cis-trans isomerase [Rikenellaceae bacterium]
MKVENEKLVSLSYTLTVDGNIVEQVNADKPLEFVYGTGGLLPKFEEHLKDLEVGGKFAFTLTPEESYGEYIDEALVDLPKDIFMVDGVVNEEILVLGNVLPMMDNDGNRLMGTIKEIGDDSIKMDFNHPMAGQTLNFEGEVVSVRVPSPEDLAAQSGGCGCGCGDAGDCDSEGGCSCDGCNN